MHHVDFAKDMRIRLSYDDQILDSSAIARMLAEKRRRQEEKKTEKGASLLSSLRQKLGSFPLRFISPTRLSTLPFSVGSGK